MDGTRKRFVGILNKFPTPLSKDVIKQINHQPDSPLNYACRNLDKEMPEGNDIGHSCRVLENCSEIISKSGLKITSNGYLSLFYASLLHDVAKSDNKAIRSDINDVLKEKCELFWSEKSDHGIRSAHYIDKKRRIKEIGQRIKLYGLKGSEGRRLLNIISFHHSGRMHPCFLPSRLHTEELLLCLLFWLADIADALYSRAMIPQSVNKKYRSSKDEARATVYEVSIRKNCIIWGAKRRIPELEKAVNMANNELSRNRLLLQAFGLPNRITYLKTGEETPKEGLYVCHDDIISANLCFDVSERHTPLVLSADTLHELYEEMVEAFCQKHVTETRSSENYFGPVVLEVKNVENDGAGKISIRSKTGKNFSVIENYTDTWLNDDLAAADKFYFGYTHGQRIWKYLYPSSGEDMEILLKDKRRFKELKGQISQFEHIIKMLGEGREARRAYVVIPNLIIDHPDSDFYIEEENAPALIAIQFMIEEDDKLSGFALLRAQELSTFFVVNYLEVKSLIKQLIPHLTHKFPNIKVGRIVMLSAFGYFDPNTVLLDKPQICQLDLQETKYQRYAHKLDKRETRKELIGLLKEFKKDYNKIETEWCGRIEQHLNKATYKQRDDIIRAIRELKQDLKKLEEERGGHSITSEIRLKKAEAVDKFIEIVRKGFE